jgi:hypothetical protein
MPTWDLLRKDYKQWTLDGPDEGSWQVGVSSIGMDLLQMAVKDPNMASTCSEWSSKCQLDLLVLMGSYSDSDRRFFRQLAFVPSPNCKPSLLPRCVALPRPAFPLSVSPPSVLVHLDNCMPHFK